MEVIDLTSEDNEIVDTNNNGAKKATVTLAGPPTPLPRMRHWRKGFYNPARKEMAAFRIAVMEQNPGVKCGTIFKKNVPVVVTVKFYMRRPNDNFRGGNRLGGVLKSLVAFVKPIRPDIDNLAKFIMDGMNGLVYADDCQVVKLVAYKLVDCEGSCGGRTVVEVVEFNETF